MPREQQRFSSDFAQARWDLRFFVIPSSIAPEEQHNERPTADNFMFDRRSRYYGSRSGLSGLLRSAGVFGTPLSAHQRHNASFRPQWRPGLQYVGHTRRQRRHCLRRRVLGEPGHFAMARQPRHLRPESEHRE